MSEAPHGSAAARAAGDRGWGSVKGLHHAAYRCRDSEATRAFYEDFLGLPLVAALRIEESKTGRAVDLLHTFYRMGDGSCLAFFEAPDEAFAFKDQHDFDLHIALEVDPAALAPLTRKAQATGIDVRGTADHGFIRSIYLRDPNGYVIELAAKAPDHDAVLEQACLDARRTLARWQEEQAGHTPGAKPR